MQELATHAEGPFVVKLPREPGRREPRYAQLLCGPVADAEAEPAALTVEHVEPVRLTQLEQNVADLQARVLALETRVNQVL